MFKELWGIQQMTQRLSMKNWSLEGDLEAKRYKHVLEAEVSAAVTAANRERKEGK